MSMRSVTSLRTLTITSAGSWRVGTALMAQVLTGIHLGFGGRAWARTRGPYSLVPWAGAAAGQRLGAR
jgi:hypothetical protein